MPAPEKQTFTHAGLIVTHYPAWSSFPDKFEVESYGFTTKEAAIGFIDTKLTEENRVECIHGGEEFKHFAPQEDCEYIASLGGFVCTGCVASDRSEWRDQALDAEQWKADRYGAPIVDDLNEQLGINRKYEVDDYSEEDQTDNSLQEY